MITFLSFIIAFIISLSPNPLHIDLVEHIETVDGVRYDMNTKIIDVMELAPVTAEDSLMYYRALLSDMQDIIDLNYRNFKRSGKSYEEVRRMIVPAYIDEKIVVFESNPDSVLYQPLKVKYEQKANGIRSEHEEIIRNRH